jgi:hypothetical protein
MPTPYGLNINLATAKKIALAAAKEAEKSKINVIIAIVRCRRASCLAGAV